MLPNTTVNHTEAIAAFRYLGISIGVVDIVLGTAGNLLTIVAVLRNKVMCKQPFNMFIVNLSIIDLLTSLLMMPFNVTGYVMMKWPYSTEACILQGYFYFSCGYSSIVCLLSITINRLLGTVSPSRYRSISPKVMTVAIFLCWVIAPIFLLPFLVASLHSNALGNPHFRTLTGWRADQLLCTFVYLSDGWKKYMKFIRFIFQLFPILIMMVSYCIILICVRRSNTRRKANAINGYYQYPKRMEAARLNKILENHETPESEDEENGKYRTTTLNYRHNPHPCTSPQSNTGINRCRSSSHQLRRGKEVHLLYVSVIVCVTLTFLFLPSFVINIIPGNEDFDSRIHMAASNVTWLNSCVNPIIYVALYKGMKKEYKSNLQDFWSWIKKWFHKS